MNGLLLRLLKYLSLIAFFTLFIPFIALGHYVIVRRTENAAILSYTLLIVAAGCCGGLISYASYRLKAKISPIILNIIKIIIGIGVSAAMALLTTSNILFSIILFPLCFVAYFLGGYRFLASYSDILSKKTFTFAMISNLIIIFITWMIAGYFSLSYDLSLLAPSFIIFTIIYFLTLNQANIDDLMLRRHHKLSQLPLKIRYYNVFLTLTLMAVLVIGYFFRNSISIIIVWVLDTARLIFKWLFNLVLWLMSFGRKGDPIAMPAPTGNSSGSLIPQEGNSAWNVLYLVFGIAIIGLLIFYRKDILNTLRRNLQALFDFFKRQLAKLTIIKNLTQSSDDYVDTVESLSTDVKAEHLADAKKLSLRSWKKSHYKFTKMENSVEKLRYGYHLILRGLTLSGVEIISSDTTLEIMRKTNDRILALGAATSSYNNVRYGDFQPNIKDINRVEDTLAHLRTSIASKPSEPKKKK